MLWIDSAQAAVVAEVAAAPASTPADVIFQVEARRLDPALLTPYLDDPEAKIRARAVTAVGRLHGPTRLLAKAVVDPDVSVRRAAAFALGYTADGLATLRTRWNDEPDATVRALLADAFGRIGTADDVDRMTRALAGPDAAAAALALGRMGTRKVDGATSDRVVTDLLGTLRLPVGDARRNAAWALARMGLTTASADNVRRMQVLGAEDGDPRVRAWLVRAAAGAGASTTWVAARAADDDTAVRTAAARALSRTGCEAPALVTLAGDADPGVRIEALTTLAGCKKPDTAVLLAHLDQGVAAERAAALRGLAAQNVLPGPLADYLDARYPLPVRVAAAESMTDHKKLLQLALHDPDPRLRSAAAGALVGNEAPKTADLVALVGASDLVVAQAAVDTLKDHPDAAAERALLDLYARPDLTPLVAASGIRALDALYHENLKLRPPPETTTNLQKWLTLPSIAAEAARVAEVALLPTPVTQRDERPLPSLATVREIRSARIFTSTGEIRVELFPEEAPLTVYNFASLAERDFFDGLSFHRVVADFVIQGGDPRGDGWGGPGYELPDELNPEPYSTGTLGMALSGPDTGGSQWFVTLSPQPHLDGAYTVFGRVTDGMDAARRIQMGDTIQDVIIERVVP